MDRETSWQVIAEQRLGLAGLLDGLSEEDWDTASLCAGWRVRDVAAHVALAPQVPSVWSMTVEGIRARGSFHRLNHDLAVRHATGRTGQETVAELRQYADSRRLPAPTNYRNALFDVLVHVQDIAIPLGRTWPMPPDAARAAAERVWTMGWPFWARRRLRGMRLTATDSEWTVGDGADVRGSIGALLLLLTGRTATLPELTGDGVALLTQRLRPAVARPR
ncbi:TIGR03083 family protein [Parafrankia irregularis]|uniref:TIGR03083 family protein n=1 Tax=Parafrankia irregularis TaxID=795642 RepID=A0A0S4QZT6_9ACTN|nr:MULTISPECIES: maleylpyruvate isomerase family mycothiol-dependent enzyme [Parafrankia]MBE3200415.1 maleylpyruvate isomerase family mycothiol-dependent enzyme [Parafrankia sp. CH37]CUU61069.1 TIGR03083 family protein [Parafrankia irregularis]